MQTVNMSDETKRGDVREKNQLTLRGPLHLQQGLDILRNRSNDAPPLKQSLDPFHFDAEYGGSTGSPFETEDMLLDVLYRSTMYYKTPTP